MRKNLICTVILIGNLLFSQVGINTDSPDSSAVLDIQSIDKTGSNKTGILIPRVELDSLRDVSNNPARGLLVYNTKTQNDVVEDNFYYFDGDRWDPLLAQSGSRTVPELAAIYRLEKLTIPINESLSRVITETEEIIQNGEIVTVSRERTYRKGEKTVILFDRNILNKDDNSNHLIDYDPATGIFTIKQDGIYGITLQVGLIGYVASHDIIMGIIAAEATLRERKRYKVNDWLGRSTFTQVDSDEPSNRTFAIYNTYIRFRKGEKFQAAVHTGELVRKGDLVREKIKGDLVREKRIKNTTTIQGIQDGTTGDGNVTNISIVKY